MLFASRQLIQLVPDSLKRGESFYGFQPEQVNHTMWDYFSREENMNGTYDIDIAWNNVLGYGAYLYIKREFKDILG